MKKLSLMWILLIAGALSACNTSRGVGEDIQAAGQGIENAAEETEEELEEAIN